MKRPVESEGSGLPSAEFSDDQFRSRFATLYSYLVDQVWDDGSTRETSTLLIFLDAGVLKGCVNDRAMGRNLFVAATSLQGLLVAANEALSSDSPGWRVFRPATSSAGKRKR